MGGDAPEGLDAEGVWTVDENGMEEWWRILGVPVALGLNPIFALMVMVVLWHPCTLHQTRPPGAHQN